MAILCSNLLSYIDRSIVWNIQNIIVIELYYSYQMLFVVYGESVSIIDKITTEIEERRKELLFS